MDRLRWGVIGATSRIYQQQLLPALQRAAGHEVVAEASRAAGSEEPYAALLTRNDIDALYIPLPNSGHKPWILRALAAGKHVLCEKPLTLSAADTEEVFAAADAAGRVLMEAYMWPHHPRAQAILGLVAAGEIGDVLSVRSTFSYAAKNPADHRFDERGAGALFDIGIYCIGPAMLMAGRDHRDVAAAAVRNPLGIDVAMTGFVDWGGGFASSFDVSMDAPARRLLEVTGTHGVVTVPGDHTPGSEDTTPVEILRRDGTLEVIDVPGANSFVRMIDQFAAVIAGRERAVFGEAESVRLAHVIDALHEASPA